MDNLSFFVDSLRDLMLKGGVSPSDIHKATGISATTVYDWLKKAALPSLGSLEVLADFFDCSLDYLLGRTEHNLQSKSQNPQTFENRFCQIFRSSGISYRKLSKATNITVSCIQLFLSGKSKPLLENLVRLADFFDCSIDYLVGRSDNY